jgi:hypothetical protein
VFRTLAFMANRNLSFSQVRGGNIKIGVAIISNQWARFTKYIYIYIYI